MLISRRTSAKKRERERTYQLEPYEFDQISRPSSYFGIDLSIRFPKEQREAVSNRLIVENIMKLIEYLS